MNFFHRFRVQNPFSKMCLTCLLILCIYIYFFFAYRQIAPLTVFRKLCALLKSISINSRKAIMFHARISLRRSVLLFDPPFDHLPRDYYLVQCARSLLPINSRQQGEQRSPFELASRLRVIRSVTVSSFRVSNPARLEPTTLPVLQHAFHHYPPLEFRGAESFGRKLRFYRFLHVEIELLETKKKRYY